MNTLSFFLNNRAPSLAVRFWQTSSQYPYPRFQLAGSSQITAELFQEIPSSTGLSGWDVYHTFSKVRLMSPVPVILQWQLWP